MKANYRWTTINESWEFVYNDESVVITRYVDKDYSTVDKTIVIPTFVFRRFISNWLTRLLTRDDTKMG